MSSNSGGFNKRFTGNLTTEIRPEERTGREWKPVTEPWESSTMNSPCGRHDGKPGAVQMGSKLNPGGRAWCPVVEAEVQVQAEDS